VIQTKIEEKMSRDWKPYPVFHLVTTAGCGSTRCLDRIQATTHWCVLMLEISPGRRSWMRAWGRELDTNMLATSSVHARERRLVGPFTPPHVGSLIGRPPHSLAMAWKKGWREENVLGFRAGVGCRFSSSGIIAWPSISD
jgi:hypothetical protein